MGRSESLQQALARLSAEAVDAVSGGARLLVLDDSRVFSAPHHFLDPYLAVAVLHKALKETGGAGTNLRRQASIVVRSGALRNLHDLIFAFGMGADALCPYLMWEQAATEDGGVTKLFAVLVKGAGKGDLHDGNP